MSSLSPSARPPTSPQALEQRIEAIESEIAAISENNTIAALYYEVGCLCEHALGQTHRAVQAYLNAYNYAPNFRPPLVALIRVFERRGTKRNLAQLLEAAEQLAVDGEHRCSALTDTAQLLEAELGDVDAAKHALQRALEENPGSVTAMLLLERVGRLSGDLEAAAMAMRHQAMQATDPALKGALFIEHARLCEASGDVDQAIASLQTAARITEATDHALNVLCRFARDHARWAELSHALEQLAASQPPEAAAMLREAARLKLDVLADAKSAVSLLKQATQLEPHDRALWHELLWSSQAAHDVETSELAENWLTQTHPDDPIVQAYQVERAVDAYRRAEPASVPPASHGVLHDVLTTLNLRASGQWTEFAQELRRRAQTLHGERKARALWEAAYVTCSVNDDPEGAAPLYEEAHRHSENGVEILRAWYGAMMRHGRFELALEATAQLLERPLPPSERSALAFTRHELLRRVIKSPDAADEALTKALGDPDCDGWAPHVARVRAAIDHNDALLIAAHDRFAEITDESRVASGHLSAKARTQIRMGDVAGAIETLKRVLELDQFDPYAVALLEELLRAMGRDREVVELLRATADGESERRAELSLLLAGSAAQSAGDVDNAYQSYLDAVARAPDSASGYLLLRDLARSTKNARIYLESLQGLARSEGASDRPRQAVFELAEHHAYVASDAETALDGFESLLKSDTYGTDAALSMLLVKPHAEAAQLIEADDMTNIVDTGAWPRYLELKKHFVDAPDAFKRASAWYALGMGASTADCVAELMLHGLRAQVLCGSADAYDEAYLLTDELAQRAPSAKAVSIAIDETLAPGDDPATRLDALNTRIAGASGTAQHQLRLAQARAMQRALKSEEAVALLTELAQDTESTLAELELLRVAARDAQRWDLVVDACERLAAVSETFEADLLEEAAVVYAEQLKDSEQSEALLRRVLELQPARPLALSRLRDMLAGRRDNTGLLAIVESQLDHAQGEQHVELLYEQARLRRALDDRDGAITALSRLQELQPGHVGGLALAAEIHVSMQRWEDAVQALRALAASDVPDVQKRVAHLGASDFLFRHLGNSEQALTELEGVEALGLADAPVYERISVIAQSLNKYDRALAALDKAVAHSTYRDAARLAVQAARLRQTYLQDPQGAISSYRRALAEDPANLDAATALVELLEPADAQIVASGFEDTVRATMRREQLDATTLRCLYNSAQWLDNATGRRLALSALNATQSANDKERRAFEALAPLTRRPDATLAGAQATLVDTSDRALDTAFASAALGLAAAAGREPNAYGVKRRDLVDTETATLATLAEVCSFVDLPAPRFYRSTELAGPPALVVEKKNGVAWVVNTHHLETLSPTDLFLSARQAWAVKHGTVAISEADALQGRAFVDAFLDAVGQQQPSESDRTVRKAIEKKVARRTRKQIEDQLEGVEVNVDAFLVSAQSAADRAGWLFNGDLEAALGSLVQPPLDLERVLADPRAADLLLFSVSLVGASAVNQLCEKVS